jgi:hypothetical protein
MCGTHRSVTLSEQRRPTMPPAFGQRLSPLCCADGSTAPATLTPPFPTASRGYKESAQSQRSSPFCHFCTHALAPLRLCSATVVHQQAITDVQPSRVPEPSSTRASTASHTDPCSELPGPPNATAFFTIGSHRCYFPPAVPQP